jgi:hypothetical protein
VIFYSSHYSFSWQFHKLNIFVPTTILLCRGRSGDFVGTLAHVKRMAETSVSKQYFIWYFSGD